jgi:hypothetical protein
MNPLLKSMQDKLNDVNNSKIFAGIIMICLNIGSKFITVKLSKSQEDYLKNHVAREFVIFAACWMGTRDILLSLLLTLVFFIIMEFLFHEESSYCIVPKYLKSIQSQIDVNGDGIITQEEIDNAMKILTKAKEFKQSKQKEDVYRYFLANKY